MVEHQSACLMWDHDHGLLPECFSSYFQPVKQTHNYGTRMATSGKLSETFRIKTETHGKNMLKFAGPRILNTIKDLECYRNSQSKKAFKKKHKSLLLSMY